MPRRWLIAPGFVVIGVGILLMRGLTPQSTWAHLLVGMIVAGLGAGFVNVPLISTAIGVVEPRRAGMASGINSTLPPGRRRDRRLHARDDLRLRGALRSARAGLGTALARHAAAMSHTLTNGLPQQAVLGVPPSLRGLAGSRRLIRPSPVD